MPADGAPRRPGRPSSLTPEIADRLVQLLASGVTLTDAAASIGVTRRSVQNWRHRAYSSRLQDRPYVELEKRLQRMELERAARPWEAILGGLELRQPPGLFARETD
jgi:Helix-turn-helix domain